MENKDDVISAASEETAKPVYTGNPENEKNTDVFADDWGISRQHMVSNYHPKWNLFYLNYRSVLTANAMFGEDYLRAFGLQVFVPRTFQTIESLKAQLNARRTEIKNESGSLRNKGRVDAVNSLDNVEWKRSGAEQVKNYAMSDALLFGIGYIFNPFVYDSEVRHYVETPESENTEPQDPEDGKPQNDKTTIIGKLKWIEKEVTLYRGMKPCALNPYYVFTNPLATNDDDKGWQYVYTPWNVAALRKFVVAKGWLTEEEAKTRITEGACEQFDAVRNTIDKMYGSTTVNNSNSPHTRRDGEANSWSYSPPSRRLPGTRGVIERFESDYYEVRLDGDTQPLYKDFNIYPHKEIPIIAAYDYKDPHEYIGIGEAEVIRHQQVEENRIHNYTLGTLLMTTVQRYAINSSLLEDETDASFANPFKPIRLKQLPGNTVSNAIMPLPQPDVKQTPFMLMGMVKETLQTVTGATDFISGANKGSTDTATESQNLLNASNSRIREKARQFDDIVVPRVIKQWHACYPIFYDTEMEFWLTGDKIFQVYLPLDRSKANEDAALINEAKAKLNAEGDTLEQVYINKGYDRVWFLSDLTGDWITTTSVTDLDLDQNKNIDSYTKVLKTMGDINALAAQNPAETQRFDTFKFGKELIRNFKMIKNPDEYITGQAPSGVPMPELPMPGTPPLPLQGAQPAMPVEAMPQPALNQL